VSFDGLGVAHPTLTTSSPPTKRRAKDERMSGLLRTEKAKPSREGTTTLPAARAGNHGLGGAYCFAPRRLLDGASARAGYAPDSGAATRWQRRGYAPETIAAGGRRRSQTRPKSSRTRST
jgi:hypothetical protein